MEETLVTFAKCFRKNYLKDLIIRHTTAQKSAYARHDGRNIDHLNQLNTIKLNPSPLKSEEERYKKCPLKQGKTVLLIDDFCTQGYSLEAARAYVEQTGAKVICLSLLKTIIRDYERIGKIDKFSPFEPNQFTSVKSIIRYPYNDYISSPSAHEEIGSKLLAYDRWQWPNNI
jgi:hypoxanthine phosphoribosyltransferase